MKSLRMAAVVASAMLVATPVVTHTASAQPVPTGSSGSYFVPVVIGAAAGATVGALLWPVIVPAPAVVAAPGAVAAVPEVASWGMGAFMTTRAAVGAIIGAGLGYVSAR